MRDMGLMAAAVDLDWDRIWFNFRFLTLDSLAIGVLAGIGIPLVLVGLFRLVIRCCGQETDAGDPVSTA